MNSSLTLLFYHQHIADEDVTFLLYIASDYEIFMGFDYEYCLRELSHG